MESDKQIALIYKMYVNWVRQRQNGLQALRVRIFDCVWNFFFSFMFYILSFRALVALFPDERERAVLILNKQPFIYLSGSELSMQWNDAGPFTDSHKHTYPHNERQHFWFSELQQFQSSYSIQTRVNGSERPTTTAKKVYHWIAKPID